MKRMPRAIILLLLAVLLIPGTGEAYSRASYCNLAKKLGAGTYSYSTLKPNERMTLEMYKKQHYAEYQSCFADGKEFGDLPWTEIQDLKMQKELDPEAYLAWKTEQEINKKAEQKLRRRPNSY